MKKIIIICCLTISHFSYSQWTIGTVLANLGNFPSVSAASPTVAWVVGNENAPVIYKTTTGGGSWVSVPTNGIPANAGLYCVFAVDANTAYVGDGTGNAAVFKTTNGGTNWTVLYNTSGATSFFNGIVFSRTNPNYGIAQCDPLLGPGNPYYLQKTTNGGTSWTLINPPGNAGVMSSQHSPFLVDNNFFGFGTDNNGIVTLTTNGGTTWNSYSIAGRSGFVSAISFASDKLNGMAAVNNSGLSKTTNGGVNWTSVNVAGIEGAFLPFVYWIPNTNVVYASSSGGGVKESTDGGVTWTSMTSSGHNDIRHMDFYINGTSIYGYAIGSDGTTLSVNDNPLPVEMTYFTNTVKDNTVNLQWQTAIEINNSGFQIERSTSDNNNWTTVSFVRGFGNKSNPTSYQFTDKNLQKGIYKYRLKQVDYNSNYEYFNLNSNVTIAAPKNYTISQNFPNPFNPVTNITYNLPVDGKVSIKVYDISGREISTLADGNMTAGYHTVSFDASNLPSGVYFYKISADNFKDTKKMTLIK